MVKFNKIDGMEVKVFQNESAEPTDTSLGNSAPIDIVPEKEKDLDMGLTVQKNPEEFPDNPPKTDEQVRQDFIKRQKKQEHRAKRETTIVGHWINNRQDDYASVIDKDGFGAKTLEAGKVTLNGIRKGFRVIDQVNPLTYLKKPIKDIAEEVDKLIDDGDPEKFSAREKIWNAVKGGGNVLDYLTTTEGIEITLAMIAVGGIALEALPEAALARLAPFLNATMTTGGGVLVTKGTIDVVKADTPEEAQKGGAEVFSGGMMLGMSAYTAKSSLGLARQAGIAAKDPTTLNTAQAMIENYRVAFKQPQNIITKPALTMTPEEIKAFNKDMGCEPQEVEAHFTDKNKYIDGKYVENEGRFSRQIEGPDGYEIETFTYEGLGSKKIEYKYNDGRRISKEVTGIDFATGEPIHEKYLYKYTDGKLTSVEIMQFNNKTGEYGPAIELCNIKYNSQGLLSEINTSPGMVHSGSVLKYEYTPDNRLCKRILEDWDGTPIIETF